MPPEGKVDRRTERSRTAIMRAFVDILLTDGYEAATVERIAERANVGRSTFYVHYKSKEAIMRQSLRRPSSVLCVLVGHELPRDILIKQLEHFHEQRRRNRIFFGGTVRTIWTTCLSEMIEPHLTSLNRHVRGQPILPLSLIARQIAEQQLALIDNWITTRPSLKTEAVAEALVASTYATVTSLLRVKPGTTLLIPGAKLQFREV